MKSPDVDTVMAELRVLAQLLGLADPGERLECLRPHIAHYAEIAIAPDSLELVVGGSPQNLALQAARLGTAAPAIQAFLACTEHFRCKTVGLKVPFGPGQPSLYSRLLVPKAEGIDFLSSLVPIQALSERLSEHQILYGLGFMGDPLVIKTYVLQGQGFVSWRLDPGGLSGEYKEYRANHQLNAETGSWGAILQALMAQGFETAGHASERFVDGQRVQPKLYFERIGAIPTDWTAR